MRYGTGKIFTIGVIMIEENKKIEYEFKILYAFSIIFIVMSHCYGGGISFFNEIFPYCTFAISPFLFTSGYFYKPEYEQNVWQYIIKKIKRLIIPLYMWNFFIGILILIIQNFGFCPNEHVNFQNLFIAPITDGLQFTLNFGSWFIFPLFMTQVLNITVRKFFRFLNINVNEIIFLICCILLGCLGVILSTNNLNQGFFLILNRILFFIPFFGMGIFYRKYKNYDNLSNLKYFSIILLSALIIIYFNDGMPFVSVNIGDLKTSFILLPYIIGALGTAFWFRISKILVSSIGKSKYISLLADNTYAIMIGQFLGFKVAGGIFALLQLYTPYCQNFNVQAWKTVWNYYYLPHNLSQMLIIYTIAGIIFPILLQKFINRINNIFVK